MSHRSHSASTPVHRAAVILAGVLLLPTAAWPNGDASFSSAEIERILRHGPWPPPTQRDPSNRVSGKPDAVILGERLFFSPRLSGGGDLLCASCHETWRRFTDGRPRALGIASADRNTQSLGNVRLNRWFGWDGSNDSLWAQSIRPLLDPREMGSSAALVAALVRSDPDLSALYAKAFGAAPAASDEALLVDAAKALAAYQETLSSERTSFDEFRDALARSDRKTAARYPAQAKVGLRIFIGRGGCAECHSGANFSDGRFHRSGVVSRLQGGETDRGREDGIRKLLAGRYSLLERFNDDARRATAEGTRRASAERNVTGAFRTPSLRDVALTAPYLHDGSAATLCEATLRHPAANLPDEARRADLSQQDVRDLAAFLRTLTASPGASFPGDGPGMPCS